MSVIAKKRPYCCFGNRPEVNDLIACVRIHLLFEWEKFKLIVAFGSETHIRAMKTILEVHHLSDAVKYDIVQV